MPSAFPAPLLEFVARFNRGEFWESHEVLEGPWRHNRSDFYKGLILFASAFVHVRRGNPGGIRAQFLKARHHLARYRPVYLGVDVEALLAHSEQCMRLVTYRQHAEADAWSPLIPRIHLRLDPALLQGDEPELRDV